jgi:hypothetical protein
MEGSIYINRKILDSEVFASEKKLKVWIWLLLKAAYKERFFPIVIGRGESIIKIQRGQLIFGRFKAEETLNIDGSTIYKILQWFAKEEMIIIESNSHYTLITITNYDTYQSLPTTKVTADEQPCNSQVTADEQPCNTYKKVNKVNKVNNISFDDFWNLYEKKVGDKTKLEAKWEKLTDEDRTNIMAYIPKYKESQPDKKYRKDPATFLNNKSWNDELIGYREPVKAKETNKNIYADEYGGLNENI